MNTTTERPTTLTASQKKTLAFMRRFFRANDALPNGAQIAEHFKIWRTAGLQRLEMLGRAGVIERNNGAGWRFARKPAPGKRTAKEGEPLLAATIEVTALDADCLARVLDLLKEKIEAEPDALEWEAGDVEGHAVAERRNESL